MRDGTSYTNSTLLSPLTELEISECAFSAAEIDKNCKEEFLVEILIIQPSKTLRRFGGLIRIEFHNFKLHRLKVLQASPSTKL